MTLDQQLNAIIDATASQISTLIAEKLRAVATELGQAASADRAAALREARVGLDAEVAKRTQDAVREARVGLDAEVAKRTQDAVREARAGADAELAARTQAAVAATLAEHATALSSVRAEAARRVADAIADAHRDAEQHAQHAVERTMTDARVAERQSDLAQFERVADAVRRFDSARSLTEILDILGEATATEAPRVALFLVRGNRLAGWRGSGFSADVDPSKVEVVSDSSSLLWRAITTGKALNTTDVEPGEILRVPFGTLPGDRAGFAVPVRVGGETVAVVYADDASTGDRVVPSAWPEVIEVLTRHAGRCLEVLTVAHAVQPSTTTTTTATAAAPRLAPPTRTMPSSGADDEDAARRYARLLVSEIKLYHEGALTEGRHQRNILGRLGSEIERARKLYNERVPEAIRARTEHFDQELVRTLANGDPSLLGARADTRRG